jgi:hypothetical protein
MLIVSLKVSQNLHISKPCTVWNLQIRSKYAYLIADQSLLISLADWQMLFQKITSDATVHKKLNYILFWPVEVAIT